ATEQAGASAIRSWGPRKGAPTWVPYSFTKETSPENLEKEKGTGSAPMHWLSRRLGTKDALSMGLSLCPFAQPGSRPRLPVGAGPASACAQSRLKPAALGS